MFKITENKFIKDGIVKYEDENANKLMIISNKKGDEIRIKVRPADKAIKVDRIVLNGPYDELEGLHFQVNIDEEHLNENTDVNISLTQNELDDIKQEKTASIMPVLSTAIQIIEDWIVIATYIHILTDSSIPLEKKTTDEILLMLQDHEETKEFADTYKKLLNASFVY